MKELKDVQIFMYGESPNGFVIPESEMLDFSKFKNVPILESIGDYSPEMIDGVTKFALTEKVVGQVIEATKLEFPYVYGNILVCDELVYDKFKNYQIQYDEIQDGLILKNVWILGIELK